MLDRFFPDLMVDSIHHIDLSEAAQRGIKGFILDIDNTLAPHHMMEADDRVAAWIQKLKDAGFKVCIVSNATEKRVVRFSQRLKIFAIHKASKPARKSFEKAARLMEMEPRQVAAVGDQIFTDIYGGNKAGMQTILVRRLDKREPFYIKLKRMAEKLVLRRYSQYSAKGSGESRSEAQDGHKRQD